MDGNDLLNDEAQERKPLLERCRIFVRTRLLTRRSLRTAIIIFLALLIPWLVILGAQYRQLRQAFINPNEFVPTRIYSDVTRIAPPQRRSFVLGRLKALGYEWAPSGESVTFKLREIDYPENLLPEDHRTLDLEKTLITLEFDGPGNDAILSTIQGGGKELTEIYLEPELITTLTRKVNTQADQIRDFMPFDQIPSGVWKSIMAVEDQHFLDHKGVDPRGFLRAIWVNLKTLSLAQGGSTLTQQLVKNLMARRSKNIVKKFNELFLALFLEIEFEKERILERYLNEVYLGQIGNFEIHGVSEGAAYFFGKKLDQLNLGEIALMAGIIRGPWYYSPYRNWDRAAERQKLVLEKMVETGQIAAEEAVNAERMPIRLVPPPKSLNKAPYFADYVKARLIDELQGRLTEQEIIHAGFRVYSTLNPEANEAAQNAVASQVRRLREQLKLPENLRLEGALASVDHSTGFIRALVGGVNYVESSFNRILNMKRQVGSTFKPFVYLAALMKTQDEAGVPYGPGYPVNDAPWKLVYDGGRQSWEPMNYEKEFRGWIPMREALAHSVNVAAAKIGLSVGLDTIARTAQQLGIATEIPLFPSITLGISELSPVELLQAYATVANRGVREEFTVIRAITQNDGTPYATFIPRPSPAIPEGPADLLTDMLREVFQTGTARFAQNMGFERPAAGKTGTTSHHRDAWFAGFTPQLTTVAWVGLDKDLRELGENTEEGKQASKIRLTGAGSALPIWTSFMNSALQDLPPDPFPISEHLVEVTIDRHSGHKAEGGCPDEQTVLEKYLPSDALEGTEACEPDYPPSLPVTMEGEADPGSRAAAAE